MHFQDMEVLLHAQAVAEKDPLAFVESLKNGSEPCSIFMLSYLHHHVVDL